MWTKQFLLVAVILFTGSESRAQNFESQRTTDYNQYQQHQQHQQGHQHQGAGAHQHHQHNNPFQQNRNTNFNNQVRSE